MAAGARILPGSKGLLNHRRNMGSSIWEYLWLLAHVTTAEPGENETSVGVVDHGNAIPTSRIATDLKRSREATLANLERLEAGNYISRSAAAGHAYSYRVRILPAELSG
jgi:hypothetical protein